jgi:hypothetical protein
VGAILLCMIVKKGRFCHESDVVLAWWCFINNHDFPSIESWFSVSAG